ncbi:MAG: TVP38/TMEM64 family protein [Hyphomonadaceae bacterium]
MNETVEPHPPGRKPGLRARLDDFVSNMDARAWRAVIVSVGSVVLLLALLIVGRFYFGDEIERFIDTTLGEANRGHWGLIATILVFTLTAYVGAPQIVLISACVVAFGPETGFWNAWIATVVSGAATYFTGRLTSAQTQKRFGGATGGRFTRFMGKNTLLASFFVRFIPTGPFIVANMAFGATRANFWAYIVGLGVGVLPKTMMVAFFGDSIMDALQGEFIAAAVMAVLAVVVAVVIALVVRRLMRRYDTKSDD